MRNILKVSAQAISNLFNHQHNPDKRILNDDMCRSAMYLYGRMKLEVEEKLLELANLSDTSTECPACPSPNADYPQFITMDGNFSQKCMKEETDFDEDNKCNLVEKMWVRKEDIDQISNVAPSAETLQNENHFRAAGVSEAESKRYAVNGLFACVCPRHEVVRKLSDMFGAEGSKYPTAMLRSLFSHRSSPDSPESLLNVMYDIACMHEENFKLTLKDLGVKGSFAIPVFHAYAHVLSCQAVRNPRNLVEYGRTDGEATERLWSDLNPFVRSTRSMLQSNRKLVLGQAIRFRNEKKRLGLVKCVWSMS